MIELVLFGAVTGFLAGLFPGIHSNLISVFIAGLGFDPWKSAIFIVCASSARTVSDSLSTVFLGVSDDVLAVFPAHKLVKKGSGFDAVKFSVYGCILGSVSSVISAPFFILILPFISNVLRPYLFWVLLLLIAILLFQSEIIWPLVIFLLSGFLGLVSLDAVAEPLFPLLTGLFGASGLLISLFEKSFIPKQFNLEVLRIKTTDAMSVMALGTLSSCFIFLFPGISPSQGISLFARERKPLKYILLTSAVGTADVFLSLCTFFAVQKARNGSVVAVESLVGQLSWSAFVYLFLACFVAVCISVALVLQILPYYYRVLSKQDYSSLSIFVLGFLLTMSFILSGIIGVIMFLTATVIGLIAPIVGTSRNHAMGVLLVPTLILLY